MNHATLTGNGGAGLSFRVPAQRWAAWPELDDHPLASATPCDVSFVEPLLRRRLSPLARMALHVARMCSTDLPRVRLVFGSQHGELNRTMVLLADLARNEPISPAAFGLSVHNTAAGIFSIARQDRSPATAVAAGEETFASMLLEAVVQFQLDPQWPVVAVYAEEPLPPEYAQFAERDERAHAIALLLHADAQRHVSLSAAPVTGEAPSREPHSIAFLRTLANGGPGRWVGSLRSWNWH